MCPETISVSWQAMLVVQQSQLLGTQHTKLIQENKSKGLIRQARAGGLLFCPQLHVVTLSLTLGLKGPQSTVIG